MSLTQEELKEIETFEKAAPMLFTGFIMDDTPQGRANAQSLASFLDGRSQQYTVANLTAAVIALQHVLIWEKGHEPITDTRTRAQKVADSGVNTYHQTLHSDTANGVESSWAKDVRLGRESKAQKAAALAKQNLRFRETSQIVQNKVNGGVDWAASNALNEAARQRHLAEDLAAGKLPVAATTKVRAIPAGTTDFTGYSPEELKAHLARSKGRAGEPHGSLLR
jgi:hypothetical protein